MTPEGLLWLIVGLTFVLPAATALSARRVGDEIPMLGTFAVLIPCFLAPLSVMHVWAIVPANLGVGMGGFEFFVSWLTRYPDLGPVNLQVLLGLLCVLGAGAMPVGFGLIALQTRGANKLLLGIWAALCLIPLAAVVVYLDVYLWLFGVLGMETLLGPVSDFTLLYGPIMRTVPLFSMAILLLRPRR